VQHRGLARAVAAQQHPKPSGVDRERDAVHDLQLAIGDFQPVDHEKRILHRRAYIMSPN
jgi:hypothetical protein